jgi:1-acyl-sn-glycerol-3-phosphate acyltransferase
MVKSSLYTLWKLYVGIIFFASGFLLYPIITPLLFSERTKKTSFYLFVTWSWIIRIACFYHVRKRTQNPLPKQPYILVSNHSSYLDIILMCSIFPKKPFLFMGKGELLSYPLLRTYFKRLHIPVFRNDKRHAALSFIKAKKAMQKGWSLMIFPEGGIPDENLPQLIPFKEGAFKLAKMGGLAIVPMTFTNNYKLFSDPHNLKESAYPGISNLHIHPHFSVEEVEKMDTQTLMNAVFERINQPFVKNEDLL